MAKRLFDIVFSGLGLILLSPLLAFLAIAVKHGSPGGAIFRQQRVGRHGKLFDIYKFRSMAQLPQTSGPQVTVSGDSRITPLGAKLRKYKLDELPQLFNVLKGDMALVGPRPEVPALIGFYPQPGRDIMLSVRPGLTDFAALELSNEEEILARYADPHQAYIDVIIPQKLALYEKYVKQASLRLDISLILQTIAKIMP